MAGRPIKPRISSNRENILERLRTDLVRFSATADREKSEIKRGGPMLKPI